ncbi:hypothetical protein VNO78_34758 [Psophocarpus tetragonolobus]|uniref:Uncharacterized protein n=1 Tax=Psophocarpus tetragonolobus TaxID=3891 RepID=A0AAN9RM71_PSOTE
MVGTAAAETSRAVQIKICVTVSEWLCCKDDKRGPTKVFKKTGADSGVILELFSLSLEWLKGLTSRRS